MVEPSKIMSCITIYPKGDRISFNIGYHSTPNGYKDVPFLGEGTYPDLRNLQAFRGSALRKILPLRVVFWHNAYSDYNNVSISQPLTLSPEPWAEFVFG